MYDVCMRLVVFYKTDDAKSMRVKKKTAIVQASVERYSGWRENRSSAVLITPSPELVEEPIAFFDVCSSEARRAGGR